MAKNENNYAKVIAAASLGNILEFYDFTLYVTFASVIGPAFFPHDNDLVSLIGSLGMYALGFLARPLGAFIFGHIGDRHGRKKSFNLTLILMSIPTALIAVLPTYEDIGIWAPILLVLLRIGQGICAGGEFSSSALFVLEQISPSMRGMIGGLLIGMCMFGAWLSSLTGIIARYFEMPNWSWRVAFGIGGLIGFLGTYVRSSFKETKAFEQAQQKGKIEKLPIRSIIQNNKTGFFAVFAFGAVNGSLVYTVFGYLTLYLEKVTKFSTTQAFWFSSLGLFTLIISAPLFGRLADKTQKPKQIMLNACLVLTILAVPIYAMLSSADYFLTIIAEVAIGLISGSIAGPLHFLSYTLFKPESRLTGISVGYSFGIAFLGGTTPLISSTLYLYTKLAIVPGFWLVFLGILGYILIKPAKSIATQ